MRGAGVSDHQSHLLWCGDHNIRRLLALAQALGVRGIASARFHCDGQIHFGNRRIEIARNVHR